jgi:hypothetical protein
MVFDKVIFDEVSDPQRKNDQDVLKKFGANSAFFLGHLKIKGS